MSAIQEHLPRVARRALRVYAERKVGLLRQFVMRETARLLSSRIFIEKATEAIEDAAGDGADTSRWETEMPKLTQTAHLADAKDELALLERMLSRAAPT